MQIILDVFGRPIFVLPVDLPAEGCWIQVEEGRLNFHAGRNYLGHVKDIDEAILALVAAQPQIGLISYPENSLSPCPDSLTHIADVRDAREVA